MKLTSRLPLLISAVLGWHQKSESGEFHLKMKFKHILEIPYLKMKFGFNLKVMQMKQNNNYLPINCPSVIE